MIARVPGWWAVASYVLIAAVFLSFGMWIAAAIFALGPIIVILKFALR